MIKSYNFRNLQFFQLFTLTLIISIALLSLSFTHAQSSGKITGEIIDKLSGDPLIGANVMIEGTTLGSSTNFDGIYNIQNVSPGPQQLHVSYIGYRDTLVAVTIVSGRTLAVDVELEYIAIESEMVEVTAQAMGQMSAINQQLSSETIKNIISAEQIEERPDVNAAESVARLPGIAVVRSGGEGSKVAIRGMSPQYSVMMVDGVRMQSTDATNRSVNLNMISPTILSSIEVTKAITADMDADAVGGTVNLKTAKAQDGFHGQFKAMGGYGQLANTYSNYEFSGYISSRFFDNKLGAQLSGFLRNDDRSSDE